MLFTGSLSGCSVAVTSLNDDQYRVYHDSRLDSSVFYDNFVMAVDYRDYKHHGAHTGLACAFMHYRKGRWSLYFQRQTTKAHGGTVLYDSLPRESPFVVGTGPLIELAPGSYNPELVEFNRGSAIVAIRTGSACGMLIGNFRAIPSPAWMVNSNLSRKITLVLTIKPLAIQKGLVCPSVN